MWLLSENGIYVIVLVRRDHLEQKIISSVEYYV